MEDVQKQVDAFMELPRAERRVQYPNLPKAVKLRARKASEARRGIARREDGGVMVLTKEAYLDQAVRLQAKLVDMPKRMEMAKKRLVDLKRQMKENHGEEALTELENALEATTPSNQA